jgi:transposase
MGSFSEDAKGNWYLNLTCEVKVQPHEHSVEEIGGDPGLKDSLVFSNGDRIENVRAFQKAEEKLAKAQRAHKKKQVRNIHQKIANKRRDKLHKETTRVVRLYKTLYLGDVSAKFLQQTNGKSSTDASIGVIRQHLTYKALRHSGRCIEVSERFSTITCSSCLKRTGPSGLSDLGVRAWSCADCGVTHDRDVNAARNVLRFGRESLKHPERAA